MKNISKKNQQTRKQRYKIHKKFNAIKSNAMFKERIRWKLYVWLFTGVFLSIIPLLYQTSFDFIIGYHIEISEILPDYLLVAFAITGNAYGMILDSENLKTKTLAAPITFFLLLFLTFNIFLGSRANGVAISNKILIGLLVFTTIYIIAIVILGAFLIIKEEKHSK